MITKQLLENNLIQSNNQINYIKALKHGGLRQALRYVRDHHLAKNYDQFDVALCLTNIITLIEQDKPIHGVGLLANHIQDLIEVNKDNMFIKLSFLNLHAQIQIKKLDFQAKACQIHLKQLKNRIEAICREHYPNYFYSSISELAHFNINHETSLIDNIKPIDTQNIDRIIFVDKSHFADSEVACAIRNIYHQKAVQALDSKKHPENIKVCFTEHDVIDICNKYNVSKLDVIGHSPFICIRGADGVQPRYIETTMLLGAFNGTKHDVAKRLGVLINNAISIKIVRVLSCFSAGNYSNLIPAAQKPGLSKKHFTHNFPEDSLAGIILSTLTQFRKSLGLSIQATPYVVSPVQGAVKKPFFIAGKPDTNIWKNGKYYHLADDSPERLHRYWLVKKCS